MPGIGGLIQQRGAGRDTPRRGKLAQHIAGVGGFVVLVGGDGCLAGQFLQVDVLPVGHIKHGLGYQGKPWIHSRVFNQPTVGPMILVRRVHVDLQAGRRPLLPGVRTAMEKIL